MERLGGLRQVWLSSSSSTCRIDVRQAVPTTDLHLRALAMPRLFTRKVFVRLLTGAPTSSTLKHSMSHGSQIVLAILVPQATRNIGVPIVLKELPSFRLDVKLQLPFGHLGGRMGVSPGFELFQNSWAGTDVRFHALGLGVLVYFLLCRFLSPGCSPYENQVDRVRRRLVAVES